MTTIDSGAADQHSSEQFLDALEKSEPCNQTAQECPISGPPQQGQKMDVNLVDTLSSTTITTTTDKNEPAGIIVPIAGHQQKKTSYSKRPTTAPIHKTLPKTPSGIPISITHPIAKKLGKGTYTAQLSPKYPIGKTVNRKSLELQFTKNKKMLQDMQDGLIEKQRPIIDKYKHLQRIQKQLLDLGHPAPHLDELNFKWRDGDLRRHNNNNPNGIATADGEVDTETKICQIRDGIEDLLVRFAEMADRFLKKQEDLMKSLQSMSNPSDGGASGEAPNVTIDLQREFGDVQQQFRTQIHDQKVEIDTVIGDWKQLMRQKDSDEIKVRFAEMEMKLTEKDKALTEKQCKLDEMNRKVLEQQIRFETESERTKEDLLAEQKNSVENRDKFQKLKTRVIELEASKKRNEETLKTNASTIDQLRTTLKERESQWSVEREQLFKKYEKDKRLTLDKRMKMVDEENRQRLDGLEAEANQREDILRNQLNVTSDQMEVVTKTNEDLRSKVFGLEEKLKEMMALTDYQDTIRQLEDKVHDQAEELQKVQNRSREKSKMVMMLQVEKESVMKYLNDIKTILLESKEEIDLKTKHIYKLQEKLLLKEQTNGASRTATATNICKTCGKWNGGLAKTGNNVQCMQFVSDSMNDLFLYKVSTLRSRLDHMRHNQMAILAQYFAHDAGDQTSSTMFCKQIETNAKFYRAMQKFADKSCEDYTNLLKLSAYVQRFRQQQRQNANDFEQIYSTAVMKMPQSSFSI